METVFLIRSSSNPDEPYKLRVSNSDGLTLKLRCFCPAGVQQALCKHVLGLLSRKIEFLYADQVESLDEVLAFLDRAGTLKRSSEMLAEIATLEAEFKVVKKEFERKRSELRDSFCTTLREGVTHSE